MVQFEELGPEMRPDATRLAALLEASGGDPLEMIDAVLEYAAGTIYVEPHTSIVGDHR